MADAVQLARAASDAALATNGVYRLGAGRFVEAATYGPGEKISGVVVTPERVQVHIVASYPLDKSLLDLAQEIRERVSPEVEGRETEIVVEDLEVTEE